MRAFNPPSFPERTITVNYDGFAEGKNFMTCTIELPIIIF